MASFIGGILFTAFILFIGVRAKKLKIEYGDFKEPRNGGAGQVRKDDLPPSQPK